MMDIEAKIGEFGSSIDHLPSWSIFPLKPPSSDLGRFLLGSMTLVKNLKKVINKEKWFVTLSFRSRNATLVVSEVVERVQVKDEGASRGLD